METTKKHTVTVYLTDAAQKAAIRAGQSGASCQTYELTSPELVARALDLGASVDRFGIVTLCQSVHRSERLDARPADAAEALTLLGASIAVYALRQAAEMRRENEERAESERVAAVERQAEIDAVLAEAAEIARAKVERREWIAAHCPSEMVERFDAGVLGADELKATMRDAIFAPLAEQPRYERITKTEAIDAANDQTDGHECADEDDVSFDVDESPTLTAEQWAALKAMRVLAPGLTVEAREHRAEISEVVVVSRMSARVDAECCGFELSREYAL